MDLNLERVRAFIRSATTEDLLDRLTVYRLGMEPAALDLITAELNLRGIDADRILDHYERRRERVVFRPDGMAYRCSFCDRPAVLRGWGWHRLFGRLPVFPRLFSYCEEHEPEQ